jgi:hypothetical protein
VNEPPTDSSADERCYVRLTETGATVVETPPEKIAAFFADPAHQNATGLMYRFETQDELCLIDTILRSGDIRRRRWLIKEQRFLREGEACDG